MCSEGVIMERAPEELLPPRPLVATIKVLDSFGGWVGTIVALLIILPLIAAGAWEVVARYFFNAPTAWAFHSSLMLTGIMIMLGAGYTLLHKMHVRLDIFYGKFPVRWQGVVDATLYPLIFFPGMIFLLIKGWGLAYHSYTLEEKGGVLPFGLTFYMYYLKMAIPFGTALLLLQGFSEFLKSLYAVWRGKWL